MQLNFPNVFKSAADLRAETQATLVDFLVSDIALAFTFLDTAGLAEHGSKHYCSLIDKAKTALAKIRHFQTLIDDPEQRVKISERADGLEDALRPFH